MTMIDKDRLRKLCFNEENVLKAKAECRAVMINELILDPQTDIDIDAAENHVDKLLREWNFWNEPTIEDLLRDTDDEEEQGEVTQP